MIFNLLANFQKGLATSKDGEDDDGRGDDKKGNLEGGEGTGEVDTHEEEEEELDLVPQLFSRRSASPAEVTVPEDFPEVPILAPPRQPLFPKLVRTLEVRMLGCKLSDYMIKHHLVARHTVWWYSGFTISSPD